MHAINNAALTALALAALLGCSNTETASHLGVEATDVQDVSQPVEAAHPAPRPSHAKLMIIGNMTDELVGDVSDDGIYVDRVSADAGGPEQTHILVVPGASASPNWFYGYMQALATSRGVPLANIALAHIASEDDSDTPDVDESTWSKGAYEATELAKLAAANVVWFDGGDQDRLVPLLIDAHGQDSPFQAALKARLRQNSVIVAGYSAGAAIMTDPMIGNGSSWAALTEPLDTSGLCETDDILCMARGLGYVPPNLGVIVDQHFSERGRFARLVRALAATNLGTGWGVSEYTAFYVDLTTSTAEVVGLPERGNVTLIGRDGARQNHERVGPPFLGDNYTVSVLAVGDTYTFPDAGHPHGVATHPIASDVYKPFSAYYSDMPVFTDAFGRGVLIDDIAAYFADGTPPASGARVDTIAFDVDESGSASGFRFRFTADKQSRVAWNFDAGYSMFGARLQITTVAAQFGGLGP